MKKLITLIITLFLMACTSSKHAPIVNGDYSATHKAGISKGSLDMETYKVKRGDTLYSIAWGANEDVADLARLNKLGKNYKVRPGQKLKLHAPENKANNLQNNNNSAPMIIAKNSPVNEYKKPLNTSVEKKQVVLPTPKTSITTTKVNVGNDKKIVEKKEKSMYSVTNSEQVVNQKEIITAKAEQGIPSRLPRKVTKWQWPATGKLIGTFNVNEQGSKGIKIAGNKGDLITAAADGKVVYAGNALVGYGNLVIIKHSEDYLSAYAHADVILVKEKQFVARGQAVAKIGSTDTNQNMLRFEIRLHGKSVDPLKYLPER